MALNDYADRELDAVERPERPIPSGRVPARRARGIAAAFTAVGVGLAAAGGGRRSLRVAAPARRRHRAVQHGRERHGRGPRFMAACRGLDVLMGGGGARAALPAAATVALHTAGVTATSQGEVHGGSVGTARAGLAITGATALAAVAGTRRRGARRTSRVHNVLSVLAVAAGRRRLPRRDVAEPGEDPRRSVGDECSHGDPRRHRRDGAAAGDDHRRRRCPRPCGVLGGVDVARRALSARRSRGDVT